MSAVVEQTEAAKLLDKMVKMGITHQEISLRLGVSYFTVYRWSRGKHEPHAGMLARVRNLYVGESGRTRSAASAEAKPTAARTATIVPFPRKAKRAKK